MNDELLQMIRKAIRYAAAVAFSAGWLEGYRDGKSNKAPTYERPEAN